jgi:hypothetical protein
MSRRVLPIGSFLFNSDRDIFNRYIPGSGVGATSIFARRAKLIKATRTSAPQLQPPQPSPPVGNSGSILFQTIFGATSINYSNNNTLNVGTNNFTIEWWQYFSIVQPFPRVFSIGNYPDDVDIAVSYEQSIDPGLYNIYFWYRINGDRYYRQVSLILNDQWAHVAIVGSSGNQIKFYLNGMLANTLNLTYNFTNGTLPLTIGNENTPTTDANFTGNITNFRWVIGTSVYTSTFSPPTVPLTNIPGTRLLLLSSNSADAFKDSSDFNRAFTNNGAEFSSDSPF